MELCRITFAHSGIISLPQTLQSVLKKIFFKFIKSLSFLTAQKVTSVVAGGWENRSLSQSLLWPWISVWSLWVLILLWEINIYMLILVSKCTLWTFREKDADKALCRMLGKEKIITVIIIFIKCLTCPTCWAYSLNLITTFSLGIVITIAILIWQTKTLRNSER